MYNKCGGIKQVKLSLRFEDPTREKPFERGTQNVTDHVMAHGGVVLPSSVVVAVVQYVYCSGFWVLWLPMMAEYSKLPCITCTFVPGWHIFSTGKYSITP